MPGLIHAGCRRPAYSPTRRYTQWYAIFSKIVPAVMVLDAGITADLLAQKAMLPQLEHAARPVQPDERPRTDENAPHAWGYTKLAFGTWPGIGQPPAAARSWRDTPYI